MARRYREAGLVGRKITATLASTGTRAHFLHPAEAIHGDLGRLDGNDVVLTAGPQVLHWQGDEDSNWSTPGKCSISCSTRPVVGSTNDTLMSCRWAISNWNSMRYSSASSEKLPRISTATAMAMPRIERPAFHG